MKIECYVSDLFAALNTIVKSAPKVSAFRVGPLRSEYLELSVRGEYQTAYANLLPSIYAGESSLVYLFAGAPDTGLLKGIVGHCTVETIDDTRLTVRTPDNRLLASYPIYLDDPEKPVPARPTIADITNTFTVDSALLKDVFTKLAKTSGDGLRHEVVALSLTTNDDRVAIDAASTDAIRLSLCQFGAAGKVDRPTQLVLRSDGVKALVKVLPKKQPVTIRYDNARAYFEFDGSIFAFELSQDRFPNYTAIMPKSQTCVWHADNTKLTAAMKALLPAAKSNSRKCQSILELVPETNELIVKVRDVANGTDLERRVQLDRCDGVDEKKTRRLAFNLAYFLEFLALNPHRTLECGWSSTTYPATLRPLEQCDNMSFTVILMPITHH